MISFSYTENAQQAETLATIDQLRAAILALPISIKSEQKLAWESMAIRIWATLGLSNYIMPKQYVATILAHPPKPTRSVQMILTMRQVYNYIHTTWRANPKPITISVFETIFQMLQQKSEKFSLYEDPCKELLEYLASGKEHPVLQAAIAHIHILTIPHSVIPGLFARAVHSLYLSKYGYDMRGYSYPEHNWYSDKATYTRLGQLYLTDHSLNTWLSFITESMRDHMEALAADMQASRFHMDVPPSFWQIHDRQKKLLTLMEAPDTAMTTKKVQKLFKISQITASRDLTRLASLGLLCPHGKGRSVFYSKI